MKEMKDSGIEWIGSVPYDWKITRIERHFKERSEKVSDKDYPPLSVTKKGIVPQLESAAKTDAHDDRKLVLNGDFVINSRSDRKQSCGLSQFNGSVSLINTVLINKDYNPGYMKYLFDNYGFAEEFYRWGNGIVADLWSTNFTKMKKIPIPYPPLLNQALIHNYLNHKIELIDNIIEKTKQSIEEYKKLKQSIITEAVTKGLNLDVKMKDSGIEWIGEIPEHWEIKKPHAICRIVRGNCIIQKDDLKETGEYVALQYGKTYKVSTIDYEFNYYVDSSFLKKDQTVNKGDVIMISTSETMEDLGHSCYYERNDTGLLGGEQICLKSREDIIGKFLYYSSTYFRFELNKYATGLKVYRYRISDLKNIKVVIPPLIEQEHIVKYLEESIPVINRSVISKLELVNELESYKKSLIYEVVTGKKEIT